MMPGFFKVARDFLDGDFWLSEPFTKPQAWVDLFGIANHSKGFFLKRGLKVSLERGQSGRSELTLSKRWKWSRNKVRRFLKLLLRLEMIALKQDNKTSIITICNYELYQGSKSYDDTPNDTPNDTPERHQKDTKRYTNKKKEKKEKNKKIIFSPLKDQKEFLDNLPESIRSKYSEELINQTTDRLKDYCLSSGKVYKDYYAALRNFLRNAKPEKAKQTKHISLFEEMGGGSPQENFQEPKKLVNTWN